VRWMRLPATLIPTAVTRRLSAESATTCDRCSTRVSGERDIMYDDISRRSVGGGGTCWEMSDAYYLTSMKFCEGCSAFLCDMASLI
jgi:hypothetical protein